MSGTVIVNLTSNVSVDDKPVENELLSMPDAIRIGTRFGFLNTLIVEVATGKEAEYANSARMKAFVEGAAPEGKAIATGLSMHPAYSHIANSWIWSEYGKPWKSDMNASVLVAIIDSGISSHDALPNLTWTDHYHSPRRWWRRDTYSLRHIMSYELSHSDMWSTPAPTDGHGLPDFSRYSTYHRLAKQCFDADDDLALVIHPGSFSFVSNTLNIYDKSGHGTAAAGLISGFGYDPSATGMCPGVRLLILQVMDDALTCPESRVLAALQRAVELGADVAVLGLGLVRGCVGVERACQYAERDGVFVIAPSGNNGTAGLSSPAHLDHVLSVGSVSRSRRRSAFSSFADAGEELHVVSFGGDEPSGDFDDDWRRDRLILAPSLHGGYQGVCGTSVSSAIAAGCAAARIARRLDQIANGKELDDVEKKYPSPAPTTPTAPSSTHSPSTIQGGSAPPKGKPPTKPIATTTAHPPPRAWGDPALLRAEILGEVDTNGVGLGTHPDPQVGHGIITLPK